MLGQRVDEEDAEQQGGGGEEAEDAEPPGPHRRLLYRAAAARRGPRRLGGERAPVAFRSVPARLRRSRRGAAGGRVASRFRAPGGGRRVRRRLGVRPSVRRAPLVSRRLPGAGDDAGPGHPRHPTRHHRHGHPRPSPPRSRRHRQGVCQPRRGLGGPARLRGRRGLGGAGVSRLPGPEGDARPPDGRDARDHQGALDRGPVLVPGPDLHDPRGPARPEAGPDTAPSDLAGRGHRPARGRAGTSPPAGATRRRGRSSGPPGRATGS